jgi:hypothetical protein
MNEKVRERKSSKTAFRFESFHQAKWNEPIIFDLSTEGQRGILLPEMDKEIAA